MRILLDSGPLGLISNPGDSPASREARAWAERHLMDGAVITVPEIADYEVRRELLRAGRDQGLARLDEVGRALGYLPLSTEAMRRAAALWADARRDGRPTAPDAALDGDAILSAQAEVLAEQSGEAVVVGTTNPRHLARYVDARNWLTI